MPLPENERDTELNSRMSVKVIAPDMLYDSLTIAAGGRLESPQAGKPGKSQQPPEFSIGPREEFINFFTGPAVEARSEEYSLGIPQLLRLMNSTALNTGTPIAEALPDVTTRWKIVSRRCISPCCRGIPPTTSGRRWRLCQSSTRDVASLFGCALDSPEQQRIRAQPLNLQGMALWPTNRLTV